MMIDIVMATHQGEKHLDEMIESILNQTYKNFRLIIGDDCSLDGTLEILRKYAKNNQNITILPSTIKLGVINNFSRILQHAKAPYVMCADQDDIWFPNKIELTLNKMKEMENAYEKNTPLLVHTDLKVVNSHNKVIHPSFWKYAHLNAESFKELNRLLCQNVVTGCTVMMNQPLLQKALPFPSNACMHDWWLALVAAAFGKIDYIKSSTMGYKQHSQNTIGASSYSFKSNVQKFFQQGLHSVKDKKKRRFQQALTFKERYYDLLDDTKKNILQSFLEYNKTPSIRKKISLMRRHQFYKSGLLRNLLDLLRNC